MVGHPILELSWSKQYFDCFDPSLENHLAYYFRCHFRVPLTVLRYSTKHGHFYLRVQFTLKVSALNNIHLFFQTILPHAISSLPSRQCGIPSHTFVLLMHSNPDIHLNWLWPHSVIINREDVTSHSHNFS